MTILVPLFSLGPAMSCLKANIRKPSPRRMRRTRNTPSHHYDGGRGPSRLELYGTVAQAHRPRTHGELVPTERTAS